MPKGKNKDKKGARWNVVEEFFMSMGGGGVGS
jgi:hypothetical protein